MFKSPQQMDIFDMNTQIPEHTTNNAGSEISPSIRTRMYSLPPSLQTNVTPDEYNLHYLHHIKRLPAQFKDETLDFGAIHEKQSDLMTSARQHVISPPESPVRSRKTENFPIISSVNSKAFEVNSALPSWTSCKYDSVSPISLDFGHSDKFFKSARAQSHPVSSQNNTSSFPTPSLPVQTTTSSYYHPFSLYQNDKSRSPELNTSGRQPISESLFGKFVQKTSHGDFYSDDSLACAFNSVSFLDEDDLDPRAAPPRINYAKQNINQTTFLQMQNNSGQFPVLLSGSLPRNTLFNSNKNRSVSENLVIDNEGNKTNENSHLFNEDQFNNKSDKPTDLEHAAPTRSFAFAAAQATTSMRKSQPIVPSLQCITGDNTPRKMSAPAIVSKPVNLHAEKNAKPFSARKEEITDINKYPLEKFAGHIYDLCKDQHGCRYLQRQLDECNPRYTQMIFEETIEHWAELVVDSFGNYLCQKLFEQCTDEQGLTIMKIIAPNIWKISLNTHGTRAIQKMIEALKTPEMVRVFQEATKNHIVALVKDLNGNHVIQKCLNVMKGKDIDFIINACAENCITVGTHRHGCCVIQRCLDHSNPAQRQLLVDQIIENALELVQNAYGNYVVQYVLDLEEESINERVCEKFKGHICSLSLQKFSSNVIEKCIRVSTPKYKISFINELISDNKLETIIRDSFGNYVIQTSLDQACESQKRKLCELIAPLIPSIRNSPHGRRVAHRVTAMLNKSNKDIQKHQNINYALVVENLQQRYVNGPNADNLLEKANNQISQIPRSYAGAIPPDIKDSAFFFEREALQKPQRGFNGAVSNLNFGGSVFHI